jgi:vacuolar-type H+-ATPase subunit C/Vma6
MAPAWDDVNARARGLAGHLLDRAALEDLGGAPDLPTLARRLAERGIETAGDSSPAGLELAVRRAGARQVRLLARWLGDRADLLRVILEDEDRRSVRALLRGAVAGAPAAARLAGLLPTPSLPERLLEELAHQLRPRDVAALLTVWKHPFGSPLLGVSSSEHPDLFAVEHALDRAFAARAVEGAARGGGALRAYVADQIDLANAATAVALAGGPAERPAESLFLPGGRRLRLEGYTAAAKAGDIAKAAAIIAVAFEEPRAALIRRHAGQPVELERALLAERIEALGRQAREDPLGPAPILRYFLRLRAQMVALRLAIWGAALGAPPAVRRGRMPQTS